MIEREGDGYVATCPELDVVSQGNTVEAARLNLVEAVEGFFEVASLSEIQRRFFKGHTMLLKVSCCLVWIPLKIDAHSAIAPSYCEVIIPGSGLRVNYERMVLVGREKRGKAP